LHASISLHGWLAWIPARLTAVGYALAGSFDGALSAWRNPDDSKAMSPTEQSESLLARVGVGAMALQERPGLVFRLLFIWAAVIAAMTLYGWSV